MAPAINRAIANKAEAIIKNMPNAVFRRISTPALGHFIQASSRVTTRRNARVRFLRCS
jgi:hypothetical protein